MFRRIVTGTKNKSVRDNLGLPERLATLHRERVINSLKVSLDFASCIILQFTALFSETPDENVDNVMNKSIK